MGPRSPWREVGRVRPIQSLPLKVRLQRQASTLGACSELIAICEAQTKRNLASARAASVRVTCRHATNLPSTDGA